jgi:5-methylcytosine-specific restriction endonuclease McrA
MALAGADSSRRYRVRNLDFIRAKDRAWRREWRKTNGHRETEAVLRMRKRRMERLMCRDGGCCRYCGCAVFVGKNAVLDHYIPQSKGGRTVDANLRLACEDCNKEKLDMLPEEHHLFLLTGGCPF